MNILVGKQIHVTWKKRLMQFFPAVLKTVFNYSFVWKPKSQLGLRCSFRGVMEVH